ncbi:putative bifunctional diguanylate cyclase/phosphodiesterase [Massilia sp. S19_KUP03_FR1]|uniref:putative bifunctional diguanylate cyclase/phosphodiesterase n=1 Tax=Massilia sp. S19_KUP03_FR1 TaxID=3025503 RepID=UPI002FCDD39B
MRFTTQLWHEKLRNHLPGILVNAAAIAAFAVIVRHSTVQWVAGWTMTGLLWCVLRVLVHRACQRWATRHPDGAAPGAQQVLLAGGLLGSAALWALAACLGLPAFSVSEQFTVLVVLAALAGGATGTLASMPIIGKIYIGILLAPSCAQLLLLPDEKMNVLGLIGLVFAVVMMNSQNNNFRLLRTTLALTSDKEELIRQLSEKNQQILQVNDGLEQTVAARTAQLEFLANHDPLTGLLNRRGFMSYPFAHRHTGRHKTIIFIDLDHFKDINDGMGHAFGDLLLRAVSDRLQEVMAELALTTSAADPAVCRWGGDEFVVCLTRPAGQPGASAAEYQRMHARLSSPFQLGEHKLPVGMSMGIFERAGNAAFDLHQALMFADIATADAKKLGRGRLSFYSERSYELQQRRLRLTLALAHAHQDGSLHLLFQPIVAAHDGAVVAYEALLRWTHPELGAVGPDEFIPLAENANTILSIGRWVLEQACQLAQGWPAGADATAPPKVAVNTSIRQLIQPDFADLVGATLAHSGLAPAQLIIEVTETVLDERNMASALDTLTAVHALGVEIHLDDFGTGYSSLSRLRQLPLDAIKIDRSFVMHMDEKSVAVIEAAVLIADRYGLRVIAEGVETAQQLAILRTKGIDELQGYYFGRPAALPLQSAQAA